MPSNSNKPGEYARGAELPAAPPGKRTPVFVRFPTVIGERGSADTVRDARGFAVEFHTEEGNRDLVGNNIPVFFIRDPMKSPTRGDALAGALAVCASRRWAHPRAPDCRPGGRRHQCRRGSDPVRRAARRGRGPLFIGARLGAVQSADGSPLPVGVAFEAASGVLFDAAVLPNGGVDRLAMDSHAIEFVPQQLRHCKPLLVPMAAQPLLDRVG